jgi:hypothetical protein
VNTGVGKGEDGDSSFLDEAVENFASLMNALSMFDLTLIFFVTLTLVYGIVGV